MSRELHAADERFRPSHHLRRKRDFAALLARGFRIRGDLLVIHVLPSGLPFSRLGLTVSRKVGKSVVRNRLRRRLREIFRRHRLGLRPPVDLVVNASPSMIHRDGDELEREFLDGFARVVRGIRR